MQHVTPYHIVKWYSFLWSFSSPSNRPLFHTHRRQAARIAHTQTHTQGPALQARLHSSLYQSSFSVNGVIKPVLLLIQWKCEKKRIRSEGMELWNSQGWPANISQRGFEIKQTSRQLCNMSRRKGRTEAYKEKGQKKNPRERERETTLVHFNGIYIKALQINSWVLDVGACKKPFRHTSSSITVKIDAMLHSAVCGHRKHSEKSTSLLRPTKAILTSLCDTNICWT